MVRMIDMKTLRMKNQARHGDILLESSDENVSDATDDGIIVAEGESTGHKHALKGKAKVVKKNGKKFVKVSGKAKIVHDEHKEITLKKGTYLVKHQREYNPKENRRIRD